MICRNCGFKIEDDEELFHLLSEFELKLKELGFPLNKVFLDLELLDMISDCCRKPNIYWIK